MKIISSRLFFSLLMVTVTSINLSCSSNHDEADGENGIYDDDQLEAEDSDTVNDCDCFDADSDNDSEKSGAIRISGRIPYSYNDFFPENFTALSNGTVLLSGYTPHEGFELWKSDGTEEGTVIVKDIFPGFFSSYPYGFARVGSHIFFSADIPEKKSVLYKTDGTAEGTIPVRTAENELVTAQIISNYYDELPVNDHAVFGSSLFFFSVNQSNQPVLMSVDEESQIAEPVKTTEVFSRISTVIGSTDNSMYFIASDKADVWKFWEYSFLKKKFQEVYTFNHSEGIIKEINTINALSFFDKFIFSLELELDTSFGNSEYQIFISDGSSAGTEMISEGIAYEINSASNGIYFLTGSNELMFTNGTASGTATIYDGDPYYIDSFKVLNDKTLLAISREPEGSTEAPALFLFQIQNREMTPFHTFKSFEDSYETPVILKYDEYWYMIDGEEVDRIPELDIVTYYDYLYKLDFEKGTKEKIDSIVNISSSNFRSYIYSADVQGGRIWISGSSIVNDFEYPGYEIIVSDGTEEGTGVVKDINIKGEYGDYFYPFAYENRLYFNVTTINGNHIKYRDISDKNSENILVSDSVRLASSSFVYFQDRFFVKTYNLSLRKQMLSSIDNKDNSVDSFMESYLYDMASVENGALFIGTAKDYFPHLYISDGTETGTTVIKEGNNETNVQSQYLFHNVLLSDGSESLFLYLDGTDETDLNYQIWITDGTEENTVKLLEGIHPYFYDFSEGMICGGAFFVLLQTTDSENRNPSFEAYLSGGTPETTHLVMHCEYDLGCKRVHIGCAGTTPLITVQSVDESKVSIHPVSSDGIIDKAFFEITGAMTGPSMKEKSVSTGEKLFFTLYTQESGLELWITDGTQKGTAIVKDINPGIESSNPYFHLYREPYLYFSASDGISGYELWRSDGTGKNTEMILDLNAGPASASIEETAESDAGLIVNGTGTDGCNQLWFIPFAD